MSSTRRSNKVSTSDTTTGKAQKGKSSHGGSKDVNNSKIKAPQPKQNPLTCKFHHFSSISSFSPS